MTGWIGVDVGRLFGIVEPILEEPGP